MLTFVESTTNCDERASSNGLGRRLVSVRRRTVVMKILPDGTDFKSNGTRFAVSLAFGNRLAVTLRFKPWPPVYGDIHKTCRVSQASGRCRGSAPTRQRDGVLVRFSRQKRNKNRPFGVRGPPASAHRSLPGAAGDRV